MNRNLTDLSNPLNHFQDGAQQWLNMPSEIQRNMFQDDLSDNITPNRADTRSPLNIEVLQSNNNETKVYKSLLNKPVSMPENLQIDTSSMEDDQSEQ